MVCEATAVRMKVGRRQSICGFPAGVGVDLMVWTVEEEWRGWFVWLRWLGW